MSPSIKVAGKKMLVLQFSMQIYIFYIAWYSYTLLQIKLKT